ncbi:MAG: mechanosensitive ion channel family protein [Candidatus Marinimicrobia bacterium]|nr:mechanosensitive ion channel family protein [Candidatus Neomarinimicrobiota bacterium]
MEPINKIFSDLMQMPFVRAGFILAGSMVAALLARLIFTRLILSWSAKTKTQVDNRLADVLHGPVVYSIILAGIALAIVDLNFKPTINFMATGIVKTLAVIIWGRAALQVGTILLEALSRQVDRVSCIQPKTLPLFEIVMKVVVIGGSIYFIFIAWHINVTSWIASAGIVGIVVGFAAKDTLANLFAGVFILADTPYKIGDFIILEDVIRGQVTDIGIRSTRLITRDDVEVTVPNAVIANSMIINETGGPDQKTRLRVKTSVAYGSDVDKVSELMNSCVKDVDHIT